VASQLFEEAAAEIERLRKILQLATVPAARHTQLTRGRGEQPPDVTQPDNGLATSGRGHFLTDEEREAIANGASSLESEAMREWAGDSRPYMRRYADTLRGLLERTK
jgi:hypothetical protein